MRSHKYYERKCIEHLSRVMLSHICALNSATNETKTGDFKSIYALAAPGNDELTSLINDVHFVALKTNFELFLILSLRLIWFEHFEHLAIESKETVKLSALTGFESEDDLKLIVIENIIPRHGLSAIKKAIKRATGIDIRGLLFSEMKLWPQIEVSFQLRNLIEHRNGKVDRSFLSTVSETWAMTSFGRSEIPPPGQQVELAVEDVSASYEAMRAAATIISSSLSNWTPSKK